MSGAGGLYLFLIESSRGLAVAAADGRILPGGGWGFEVDLSRFECTRLTQNWGEVRYTSNVSDDEWPLPSSRRMRLCVDWVGLHLTYDQFAAALKPNQSTQARESSRGRGGFLLGSDSRVISGAIEIVVEIILLSHRQAANIHQTPAASTMVTPGPNVESRLMHSHNELFQVGPCVSD